MMEVFLLYKFALLLSFIAAPSLAATGAHLVARREALQVIALSQAALVGSLIGQLTPAGDVPVSCLLFGLAKLAFLKHKQAGEAFYATAWLGLGALAHLLITLFPALEAPMSLAVFGDIVSLSESLALWASAAFALAFGLLILFGRSWLRVSFAKSVFGSQQLAWPQEVFVAAIVLLSLHTLGLLFTTAFMIAPAALLGDRGGNLRRAGILMNVAAATAAVAGLSLSLCLPRVGTVPAQVLCLMIAILLFRFLDEHSTRANKNTH